MHSANCVDMTLYGVLILHMTSCYYPTLQMYTHNLCAALFLQTYARICVTYMHQLIV